MVGGTGFVGSYLVDELIAAGHRPNLLVRPGSEAKVAKPGACRTVAGELNDDDRIRELMTGCEAAVYLVGILREDRARGVTFDALQREGAQRTMDIARAAGVERFGLLSANGVRPDGNAYQVSKWRAEQHLGASGMAATILRPSVLFGDPCGRMEFCTQLRDEMIGLPLPAPLFFDGLAVSRAGRFLMSPVHVGDVARVLVRSLEATPATSATHVLCGPDALEWREIIRRIAAACGRSKLALPAPALPLRIAATLLDSHPWFPITRDQLDMLLEGNTGDSGDVFGTLRIEPTRFAAENLAYLAS
jgi:NADH dehydrogenase